MRFFQFSLLSLLILLFTCSNPENTNSDSPENDEGAEVDTTEYNIPEGFELEKLYYPSSHNQGTWVSLAEGANGIFYASDQRGDLYQFKMPTIGAVIDSINVDSAHSNTV